MMKNISTKEMRRFTIRCSAIALLGFLISFIACTPKNVSNLESPRTTETAPPPPPPPPLPEANPTASTDKKIPTEIIVRQGVLENGMQYFIRKNQKPENRAELRLALNAGAMQEDEDQRGLAHFVEHMAFNGSKNFKKSELVDYLETVGTRFGPDLNAYTSFDETVYMLQVRTDEEELLNKGLLVIEDWAGGVAFDNEEIDKERGVVESEWRSGLSPQQRLFNTWFPVMYQGSRYAERLPIGKTEVIKNATYETVKRFYKEWYRPDLMAVVVVGDFDPDMMEKEIKERFSKLENPATKRTKESAIVPTHKETLVSISSDEEAPFSNVQLVYKHPHQSVKTMEDYRDNIVRRLYNGMLNARLDELSAAANAPFNYAYTGYSRDVGDIDTYSSYAMVPEGGTLRGLEVILEENERVLRHGFNATELERQKAALMNRMEKAFKEQNKTDSGRLSMRYVYHFLKDNPIPSIGDEVKFYETLLPTIRVAEVNALAKEWITDENRVVVISGPKKEESPLPAEADVRNLLETIKQKEIAAYVDESNDAPLLAEIPKASLFTQEKVYEATDVTELVLANGVKVVLKPTDFKNDEIMLSAFSPGGTSLASDQDYFSATSAARVIDQSGVGEFNLTQLQKKLTGKTVSISPYIGELYEGMSGAASPDDLETMLQLVYLYFHEPRKDGDALKSYVTKQKSIYKNLLSQPDYYFYDKVSKIQYGNHPRRGFPTAENMESIDLEKLYNFYKDRFADASDFTFTFVGNFEVEKIKPMLATYLGNLPSNRRKDSWKDVGANYKKGKVSETFNRGEAPKSQINLMYHGDFEYTPQNKYDFQSMIQVLRIKMRESMREELGGVYGVRVSGNTSKFPKEEYDITISFNADPPMVDKLIEAAMKDIKNAQMNGAEEKDLTKVKETQRQGRIKDLKENRYWSRTLQNIYKNEGDPSKISLEELEKYINGLDSDDIKKAANTFFDEGSSIKVIMMPEKSEEG
ncbi:MAG: M16 family metallopeptidase [Saprospiraceae bacterium]